MKEIRSTAFLELMVAVIKKSEVKDATFHYIILLLLLLLILFLIVILLLLLLICDFSVCQW